MRRPFDECRERVLGGFSLFVDGAGDLVELRLRVTLFWNSSDGAEGF
jgi:hypothetical protein